MSTKRQTATVATNKKVKIEEIKPDEVESEDEEEEEVEVEVEEEEPEPEQPSQPSQPSQPRDKRTYPAYKKGFDKDIPRQSGPYAKLRSKSVYPGSSPSSSAKPIFRKGTESAYAQSRSSSVNYQNYNRPIHKPAAIGRVVDIHKQHFGLRDVIHNAKPGLQSIYEAKAAIRDARERRVNETETAPDIEDTQDNQDSKDTEMKTEAPVETKPEPQYQHDPNRKQGFPKKTPINNARFTNQRTYFHPKPVSTFS